LAAAVSPSVVVVVVVSGAAVGNGDAPASSSTKRKTTPSRPPFSRAQACRSKPSLVALGSWRTGDRERRAAVSTSASAVRGPVYSFAPRGDVSGRPCFAPAAASGGEK
jgi:hypothetical protein